MSEVSNTPLKIVYPPNLEYPDAWRLGESGPEGLLEYMKWTLRDDERVASAAERLRFNGAGFHSHNAAQLVDTDSRTVRKKVDVNIFSEEFLSTNPPDGGYHAHSRESYLYAMYDPKARQTITHVTMLPPGAPSIQGYETQDCDLAVLNKVPAEDGLGTIYNPTKLGARQILKREMHIPPLTEQHLLSLDIHTVQYRGDRAGATVLRQGPMEPQALNTTEGLMCYKGFTYEEAVETLRRREAIGNAVCSTALLRLPGTDLSKMEKQPLPVPLDRYAYLAEDVVYSLERLIRSQAAA